ncbi:MAG: O-antigen ligase family protein [Bacteroidales bacterium]|nr:O-antigen ligase family protein [Bacteroidales bacterium]
MKYLIVFFPVAIFINFKFYTYYFAVLLIFAFLYFLLEKKKIVIFKKEIYWFALPLFYFIHFIFLINTSNMRSGYFDLEVKASLLLMPIVFFIVKNDNEIIHDRSIKFIYYIIFISTLAMILIHVIIGLINVFKVKDIYPMFYVYIAKPYHPAYLSLYTMLGLVTFYKMNHYSLWRVVFLSMIYIFLFLLSSKAGIVSLLLMFFLLLYLKFKEKKFKAVLSYFFMILIFILAIMKYNPRIYVEKMLYSENINIIKESNFDYSKYHASTPVRILIWKTTLELIKQNLLFGVGTGDIKDELVKKYKEKKFVYAFEQKLNAHNQFLETLLAQGILGLLSLLSIFGLLFYLNLKTKNVFFFAFTLFVFANFFFESMLNTQAGVVLFSFFYCINLLDYELEKRRFCSVFATTH